MKVRLSPGGFDPIDARRAANELRTAAAFYEEEIEHGHDVELLMQLVKSFWRVIDELEGAYDRAGLPSIIHEQPRPHWVGERRRETRNPEGGSTASAGGDGAHPVGPESGPVVPEKSSTR